MKRLYKQSPETEKEIGIASDYAEFHVVVTKVLLVGAGGGTSGNRDDFEMHLLSGSGLAATVTARTIRIAPIKELNRC